MSSKDPPSPFPLNPIYNPNDWIPQNNVTIDVAYLDAHYLRYPTAQGSETLQSIVVNGTSTFYDSAQFRDGVLIVDTTAISTTTESLGLSQNSTGNRITFCLNPVSGGYNGLTQANDNILIFGKNGGTVNTGFTLAPWANTTNGIRLDQTTITLGSGGATQTPSHRLNTDTTQFLITSSNFRVNGTMNLITAGTGIRFPDNSLQTTAYTTSALKVQTFTITTNQTNYLIPTNVYKVDFKVIGRGGNYGAQNGSYSGGSGAGAQTVMLNGCPLIDGYYINISFVATAGATIGYTQVQDVYDSTIIARAYNGGDGQPATPTAGGIGGVVSPFSGATNPVINSNYGNAYALQGTNGSAGGLNTFPITIGLVRGSPPNTTFNYGNGNLNSTSTWGTGAVIITMYYK